MFTHPKIARIFYPTRTLPNQQFSQETQYSITTQLILNTAQKMGIKTAPIPNSRIIQLQYQNQTKYFSHQLTCEKNSYLSHQVTENKAATKFFLDQNGISTPQGFILNSHDSPTTIENVFHQLPKPMIIKPLDQGHGLDVILDLQDFSSFKKNVHRLFKKYPRLLVEEMFIGEEFRLTASHEQLFAVTQKIPAHVTGDGQNSVAQLITQKNRGRGQDTFEGHLVEIKVDAETMDLLDTQDSSLTAIPALDQHIQLKNVSNISVGGDSVDLTPDVHPDISDLALKVINSIPGLYFGGIDLICEDIKRPLAEQRWAILEINDSPGFCMAEMCASGQGQNVAAGFLKLIFAPD